MTLSIILEQGRAGYRLLCFQTLKIIGFIHNTSGSSLFFFSNLCVWSGIPCEYAPEEPSTRLVDNDDLGGKYNTNHIGHIWKRKTV